MSVDPEEDDSVGANTEMTPAADDTSPTLRHKESNRIASLSEQPDVLTRAVMVGPARHPIEVVPQHLAEYMESGGPFTAEVCASLVSIGADLAGLGRYARRKEVPIIEVMRAIKPLAKDDQSTILRSFRTADPSRALSYSREAAYSRPTALLPYAHGANRTVLSAFLDEIEATGGSLPSDVARAKQIGKICNEESIPISSVAAALQSRGARGRAIAKFMSGMLSVWTGYERMTDTGNARRFIVLCGEDIRYCPKIGWFVWDGTRWMKDELGDVEELAKLVAESWRADIEAMRALGVFAPIDDLEKWAKDSESAASLRNLVKLAQTAEKIAISPDMLDACPWLLPARNGTIELRTGTLRPHSCADLMTSVVPTDYDPDASSPLWDAFLDQAVDGDEDLKEFLQRAGGFTICGDAGEEVLLLVHGPGGSGKSTLMDAMRGVMGGFAKVADFETFVKKPGGGGIRNDIAGLKGARMVCSIEVDEGKELAEGLVKTITGGDTVAARFLYHEFFEFKPEFTLWLVANDPPTVDGADSGMARRMRVVPLTAAVPKDERKKWVKELLKDPDICGPAVLNWLVKGFQKYQSEGLGSAPIVDQATTGYMDGMDEFGDFLRERCIVEPGVITTSKALYAAYGSWAEENGETILTRLTPQAFGRKLTKKGFHKKAVREGRAWVGISLLPRPPWGFGTRASNPSGRPELPSG